MFPEYSTIQNGNPVDIDIDWTPSLHMTDAVLNIGLKVKESILMGEPFHPAVAPEDSEPVDDLVKGARRFGSFLSKSAFSFSNTVAPPGAAVAPPTAAAADPPRNNPLRRKPKEQKRQASSTSISIGDEINLMEAPWVDCRGLYSCKAIRRPGFLEDAIALAAKASSKNEVSNFWDDEDDDGDIPATGSSFQRAPVANYRDSFGAKETTTKGNQSNLFDYDDVSFGASKDSSHAFKKNPFDDDDDESERTEPKPPEFDSPPQLMDEENQTPRLTVKSLVRPVSVDYSKFQFFSMSIVFVLCSFIYVLNLHYYNIF